MPLKVYELLKTGRYRMARERILDEYIEGEVLEEEFSSEIGYEEVEEKVFKEIDKTFERRNAKDPKIHFQERCLSLTGPVKEYLHGRILEDLEIIRLEEDKKYKMVLNPSYKDDKVLETYLNNSSFQLV